MAELGGQDHIRFGLYEDGGGYNLGQLDCAPMEVE